MKGTDMGLPPRLRIRHARIRIVLHRHLIQPTAGLWAGKDRGSGTMTAVALTCCVAVALTIGLLLGAVLTARARARTAADAAALAAASAWHEGVPDPCEVARETSAANAAAIVECSVAGDDIVVTAQVSIPMPMIPSVTYESRAGPREC
ncbi:MAG: Rv3654c family TadE-like protein [Bifidobacterium sp.]|uniref:Rv3654c family TadE-like protein n=2 Tax=Bifidobacterium sp. TaxID=41200 RepID=UPI0039ED7E66